VKSFTITRASLDSLIDTLSADGFEVIGPVVRDRAVTYRPIATTDDLPVGVGATLGPGTYRLTTRDDGRLFGYPVGPGSVKEHLFRPRRPVWTTVRDDHGIRFVQAEPDERRIAVIGARPCDVAAIAVQDRTFLGGPHQDSDYAALRSRLFVVAVNCTEPGETCFCASMGTGPRATTGFDLALTEIGHGDGVRYIGEAGTRRGEAILDRIPHTPATDADLEEAGGAVAVAADHMGRTLDTEGLPALLGRNLDHPRWTEVAERCLACGNCTMVCPTCFCATVEDSTDLAGTQAERRRVWDSCFSIEFSYVHGGSVRTSAGARYRQWLTHKLATWHDQFGVYGCVGCGRCITWCPVGIDITAEARAIDPDEAAGSRP
jgi:ferredoxin